MAKKQLVRCGNCANWSYSESKRRTTEGNKFLLICRYYSYEFTASKIACENYVEKLYPACGASRLTS